MTTASSIEIPQRRHLGNYTKYRRRCERALSDPRAWRRLTNYSVVYALINISARCSRLRRRGKNHGCRDDDGGVYLNLVHG